MPQWWIWVHLSVESNLFLAGPVFLLWDGQLELDLVELVLELANLLWARLTCLVHVAVVILQTLYVILRLQQLQSQEHK